MKRLYKTMLLVIMSFVCLIYGRTAYAANDDFTRATDISVNKAVTDNLTSSSDQNYYKFNLPKNGYVNLLFSHNELEKSDYLWKIRLYNESKEEIKTISSRGSKVETISNNIGLPMGTYYIHVLIYDRYGSWSSINYQLCVNYYESEDWEKEFNNGYLEANLLEPNKVINGSLMTGEDNDYYKFSIGANGYINLKFNHIELEESDYLWKIRLYDESREEIKTISSQGSKTETISNNIGLPMGTYYVQVLKFDRYGDWSSINYQLCVNYFQSDGWETEFNDGYTQADELNIGKSISGSLLGDYDKDYYKFTVPQYGYIKIDFTHAWLETDLDCWRIELYDETRNNLGRIMSKGSKPNDTAYAWLGAGTYYICVDNQYLTNSTVDYALNVTYSTPKARIKSLTSDSEKLTLKWKKLQGISGYQIVTATNKKFTKKKKVTAIKSKKKNKTTIKKLKRKKTYYVKMRGYITVNGVKYYGPYSKVKKIKIR